MAQYGKKDLIDRLSDYLRKGWTNQQVKDLIDSLWRDPWSPRTSGFELAGGADCGISAEATMTEINGNPFYGIAFQITPINKRFAFYQYRTKLSFHKKYESEYLSWAAEEGLFAVYYDYDATLKQQTLHWLHNPTHDDYEELFSWVVPIMFIYYDAENNQILYRGNNKHGSLWNPWIHFPWHQTFNSMRETGLEFTDLVADGDGSENEHAQFGVSSGTCFHEDIYVQPSAKVAPASFPVWFFNSTGKPRIYEGSVNSLVVDGLLCYNSGGEAVPADDGYFVMYHIFFSNDILEPFLSVMGQDQYEKVSQATLMIDVEVQQVRDMLPHQNLLHIGTLIFQTSSAFSNSYKSRIVSQSYGVITRWSVEGDGSAATPVQLLNDEADPAAGMFYGTDPLSGMKGWVRLDPRLLASGQVLYLKSDDSDISGYKQMLNQVTNADATYTKVALPETGEQEIKSFATNAGTPGVTLIEPGPWIFTLWAAVSTNDLCHIMIRVYKRTSGGTETELFSVRQDILAVAITQHIVTTAQNQIELAATDRIVVKYFGVNNGSNENTFYLSVEGDETGKFWWSNVRLPLPPAAPVSTTTQEPQHFDWADIESGESQTYPVCPYCDGDGTLLYVALEADATMDDITIEINGSPVEFTGSVYSVDVDTTMTKFTIIGDNTITEGDRVTLVTSGTDAGATRLTGTLVIQKS